MQARLLILTAGCLLAACSSAPPDSRKSKVEVRQPPEQKTSPPQAQTLLAYKEELARRITQANADQVYAGRPQALLRSVIVLKYLLNADGKLLHSEIVRSNRIRASETTALSSLNNAAPFEKPPAHLLRNGKLELVETWLFNDDGRFQLRTIALPQLGE